MNNSFNCLCKCCSLILSEHYWLPCAQLNRLDEVERQKTCRMSVSTEGRSEVRRCFNVRSWHLKSKSRSSQWQEEDWRRVLKVIKETLEVIWPTAVQTTVARSYLANWTEAAKTQKCYLHRDEQSTTNYSSSLNVSFVWVATSCLSYKILPAFNNSWPLTYFTCSF